MLRATLGLSLCLLLAPSVWADVLYMDDKDLIPDPKPKGAVVNKAKKPDPSTGKVKIAVRGRIIAFAQPGDAEMWVDFQVLKEKDPTKQVYSFEASPHRILMKDVRSIVHTIDYIMDLRWIFGNRDEQLIAWRGKSKAAAEALGMGNEVSTLYMLHDMGLIDKAELKQLLKKQGAPAAIYNSPDIPGTVKVPYREGWLVRLVRDGPITDMAKRQKLIVDDIKAGKLMMFHPLMLEPSRAYPDLSKLPSTAPEHDLFKKDVLKTDIKGTVLKLLRAGAQDFHFGRSKKFERGGFGLFGGLAKNPDTKRIEPTFAHQVLKLLRMMCRLTRYKASNAVAHAVGVETRTTIIEALEAAARDRIDPTDPANKAHQDAQIDNADPSARTYLKARRKKLLAASDETHFEPVFPRVDPSQVAMGAMKVIEDNAAWRKPLDEQEGRRLIRALVSLAPRARKWHKVAAGEGLADLAKRYRLTESSIATLNGLPLGGSLTSGKALEIPTKTSYPRAQDFGRKPELKNRRKPHLGPKFHSWLGVETRLRRVLRNVLCGIKGILMRDDSITDKTKREEEEKQGPLKYRTYVTELMAQLDRQDQSFIEFCLAQSGFGTEKALQAVVDHLFAVALSAVGKDKGATTIERLEARDRRHQAIATLGKLTMLNKRWKRNDGKWHEPTAAEENIANIVHKKITALLDAEEKGWSGHAQANFFKAVKDMANTPRRNPGNTYFARDQYHRAYARALMTRYKDHIERRVTRRRRELATLDRTLQTYPERKKALQNMLEREDKVRGELRRIMRRD